MVRSDGTAFEFDHDWAESFTRLRSGDQTGLAHYECVVIRPPGGIVTADRARAAVDRSQA